MTKMKIRKGDTVLVLAGKENGKTAEVLECFPEENRVTVKGLNMIVKHNKPRSAQDKGGIVKKEGKMDASDVIVICPFCHKATRIKMGFNEKGEKVRMCKKCGAVLDTKKAPATKKEAVKKAVKETKPAEKKEETKKTATKKTETAKKTTTAKAVKDTKTTKSSEKTVKAATKKTTTSKKTATTAKKAESK